MVRVRSVMAGLLLMVMAAETVLAVDSKGAAYYGGTAVNFQDAKAPVEGRLDTRDEEVMVFTAEDKGFAGEKLSIRYDRIIDLEYGQKAGRRVGAAIGTTILLGPLGLLTLLSKKRKHYLTIGFKDDAAKDQVAVIELGKDLIRSTLPIIETRSGKKVEYQDEEARKSTK